MARIGLLGGSFNPAHGGHRHISLEAIRALGLDEVWWLVSPGNPLKEGGKDMAPFEARLASARTAAKRTRYASAISSSGRIRAIRSTPCRFEAPLSRTPVHLVARKRHPAKFSQMARLERVSTRGADCGDSPARVMIQLPTRRARWAGLEGSSILRARHVAGRTGVHRRSFSFACRPIRRPQRPSARTIPTGIARTNASLTRSYRFGSPMSLRRPLDRTSS